MTGSGMAALARKLPRGTIATFLRFALVGTIGFVVDGAVLSLVVWLGVDPFLGRAFSFPPALFATWTINRLWTFSGHAPEHKGGQFARYLAIQLVAMAVNWAVYSLVLWLIGMSAPKMWFALGCGAGASLFVNFAGSRLLVFRHPD